MGTHSPFLSFVLPSVFLSLLLSLLLIHCRSLGGRFRSLPLFVLLPPFFFIIFMMMVFFSLLFFVVVVFSLSIRKHYSHLVKFCIYGFSRLCIFKQIRSFRCCSNILDREYDLFILNSFPPTNFSFLDRKSVV